MRRNPPSSSSQHRPPLATVLARAAALLIAVAGNAGADPDLREVRGVVHVHTHLSHDSNGSAEELIVAADKLALDFVMTSEHWRPGLVERSLRGRHGNTLFVPGLEAHTSPEQSVLLIGLSEDIPEVDGPDRPAAAREQGGQVWLAHAERWQSGHTPRYDGIEIYNFHFDALFDRGAWLELAATLPAMARGDVERAMASLIDRPDAALAFWDEELRARRIPGIGGNDAHANIGLPYPAEPGSAFDRYDVALQMVHTHLFVAGELTPESLAAAMKAGRGFVCHRIFADCRGLFVELRIAGERVAGLGEEAVIGRGAQLIVRSPHAAELVLVRDGTRVVRSGDHRAWSLPIAEPGVYRIELLIDDRFEPGTKRPWAYTNPIYVRAPQAALSDVAAPR